MLFKGAEGVADVLQKDGENMSGSQNLFNKIGSKTFPAGFFKMLCDYDF